MIGGRGGLGYTCCVLVLAVGARKGGASYPVDEAAVRLGAGVDKEVESTKEAYARFSPIEEGPAPDLS